MLRSTFEEHVVSELYKRRIPFEYETLRVDYVIPEQKRYYKPDFYLKKHGIIIEAKGLFTSKDRQKHLLVREQNPHLKIYILFMNSRVKLSKNSETTYGQWCEKHGITYADWKRDGIPEAWLEEIEQNENNSRSKK